MGPIRHISWDTTRFIHGARRHWRLISSTAAVVVMLVVSTGLLRMQRQLTRMDARLGADIVVSAASMAAQARQPLLIDLPQSRSINQSTLAVIRRFPGVGLAVPLYNMGKLSAQECPSCAFGFSPQFVGIDPQSAFNVWPWWQDGTSLPLTDHTLIAGWEMPNYLLRADWSMFGEAFTVAGILQPTGTPLDHTMLMTMNAAQRLSKIRAKQRNQTASQPLEPLHPTPRSATQRIGDPDDGVSAVLIRTRDGMEPQAVGTQLALQGWDLDVAVAPAYITSLRHALVQARQTTGTMGYTLLILAVFVALVAWCPSRVRRKLSSRIWQRPGLKAQATQHPSSCTEEIATWHHP